MFSQNIKVGEINLCQSDLEEEAIYDSPDSELIL